MAGSFGAKKRGTTRTTEPKGPRAANDNARWRYLPRAGDPVILLFWEDDVQGQLDRILFTAIRAPEFQDDEPELLRLFAQIGWSGSLLRNADDRRTAATTRWCAEGPHATLQRLLDRLPVRAREMLHARYARFCADPLADFLLPHIQRVLDARPPQDRTVLEDLRDLLEQIPFCS